MPVRNVVRHGNEPVSNAKAMKQFDDMLETPDIPESPPAGRKKRKTTTVLLAVAKWAIFLVVLFFVGRALVAQFAAISWSDVHFSVPFVVLALVCTLVAKGLYCLTYHLLLVPFCRPPGWLPMMGIAWLPEIGKYIPGKVTSILGAVWLLRRHKVSGPIAVSTVYVMNGLWVVIGLLLAVPLTLWQPLHSSLPMVWLWYPALVLVGLICVHPRVFGPVGNFLLRKMGYETMQALPRMRHYAKPAAVMLLQWFLLGLGFWCVARSFMGTPVTQTPFYVSALALAGTIGSLAIFAPGRLGVQEGLLFLILGPSIGVASAAILVVAVRIVHILADITLAALGLMIFRLPSVKQQAEQKQEPGSERQPVAAPLSESERPLRVCVVTTSYPRWPEDPAGTVLTGLTAHLASEQNVEMTILAPSHVGVSSREIAPGLEVRRLRYFWPARLEKLAYGSGIAWNLTGGLMPWINLPFFLVVFAGAICKYARKADVVHAHWGVMGALAILMRPIHRRPVVVTIHGTDWRTRIFLIRWLTRYAIKRANVVTTPSMEFHQEFCRIRADKQRCYFVPNGIDYPACEEVERRRAASESSGNGVRIISVGRLVPERRYDLLIRAFAGIKRRFGSATLTLVGDGPSRNSLQLLADEQQLSDSVHLVGLVSPAEVPRYLLSSDLYVSPTSIESFGMAVLEAAVYGLPIITTQVGFAAKIVVDSETGYIVPPNDEHALVEAMTKMLEDPEQLSASGKRMRERVEQLELTWSRSARKIADLYKFVTSKSESMAPAIWTVSAELRDSPKGNFRKE
ncbi:MAG: glycosyltransferase [Phycisphaerae bacterium]|nr:glycosyltransferase [Phycisphaerae bacterium]